MKLKELIYKLQNTPDSVTFNDVISTIESEYHYTPCRFYNGVGNDKFVNEVGCNEGSCKVFAFANLNHLNDEQTLQCFGDYYRKDVMQKPQGDDHANIRTFIRHGWAGIEFDGIALTPLK